MSASRLIRWIFALSLLATTGSLYFEYFGDPIQNLWLGELFNPANGLAPCTLCWWARIWLYPITLLSGMASIRNELIIAPYLLPLGLLGALTTGYHTIIQTFSLPSIVSCSSTTPCSTIQVAYFGFITIPLLGFVASVALSALAYTIVRRLNRGEK